MKAVADGTLQIEGRSGYGDNRPGRQCNADPIRLRKPTKSR